MGKSIKDYVGRDDVLMVHSNDGRSQPFRAIEYAARAISDEDTRYALSKVLIIINNRKMECVGTDGRRLHIGRCETAFHKYGDDIYRLKDGKYLFNILAKTKTAIALKEAIVGTGDYKFPPYDNCFNGLDTFIEATCKVDEPGYAASTLTYLTGMFYNAKYADDAALCDASFRAMVHIGDNKLACPVRLKFDNQFEAVLMPVSSCCDRLDNFRH